MSKPVQRKKNPVPEVEVPEVVSAVKCSHHNYKATTKTTRIGNLLAATSTCSRCGVAFNVSYCKIKDDDIDEDAFGDQDSEVEEKAQEKPPQPAEKTLHVKPPQQKEGPPKPPKLAPPSSKKRGREGEGASEEAATLEEPVKKQQKNVEETLIVLTEQQKAMKEWSSMSNLQHPSTPIQSSPDKENFDKCLFLRSVRCNSVTLEL